MEPDHRSPVGEDVDMDRRSSWPLSLVSVIALLVVFAVFAPAVAAAPMPPAAPAFHVYLPLIFSGSTPVPCSDGFVNGDFETDTGWELRANPAPAEYTSYPVHSGAQSVRTGIRFAGNNIESFSPIQQIVDFGTAKAPIPVDYATLSFWHFNIYLDQIPLASGPLKQVEQAALPQTLEQLQALAMEGDFFYAHRDLRG